MAATVSFFDGASAQGTKKDRRAKQRTTGDDVRGDERFHVVLGVQASPPAPVELRP